MAFRTLIATLVIACGSGVDTNPTAPSDAALVDSRGADAMIQPGPDAGHCAYKLDVENAPEPVFEGGYLVAATSGDYDADGRPEVAMTDVSDRTLVVYPNLGGRSFAAGVSYPLGPSAISAISVDLDRDGRLDVATRCDIPNAAICILPGLGNGTFGARVTRDAPAGATAIAAGDVNGDGAVDFASTDFGSDSVTIFLGMGSGWPGSGTTMGTGAEPVALTFGRLFGGPGEELLVTTRRAVHVIGADVASAPLRERVAIPVDSTVSAGTVADVDGDGDDDIIIADAAAGSLLVLLQSSPGVFGAAMPTGVTQAPITLVAADLNLDGRDDVVALDGSIKIFAGRADGSLELINVAELSAISMATGISVADFDGDGLLDIVVAGQPSRWQILYGKCR